MEIKEINLLSDRICEMVINKVEALYPLFMKRVNDIDIDYFEDIVRDSEELPKELNFELRDTVLNDIKAYATQLLEESNIKSRVEAVAKDVEEATKKEVFDKARPLIRSYVYTSCVLNGSSDFTEEELKCMYEDAKKRDLWEIIMQNNKKDVIEFHNALMNRTYELCKDVLYECLESYLFE